MLCRAARSLLLPAVPALAALVFATGCGRSDEAPADPNRTTWQGAFDAALGALGRQDYAGLRELLTPVGRVTLDADLQRFCEMVAHPVEGPRLMAKVRQRWPEVPDALVEGARAGRLVDGWALFLGAGVPRGQRPQGAGVRLDPTQPEHVLAFYRYLDGPQLAIELRRIRGAWAVDKLSLGSP